jgi:excisionase family DNA binding protein
MPDQLLVAEDVAAMLGMTKDWVYEQARKDAIPHIKLGRYTRFRRKSIEDWIRERERGKIRST